MMCLGKYDLRFHDKARGCWVSLQERFCQPPPPQVSVWIDRAVDYHISAALDHELAPINFMELEDPEERLAHNIEGPTVLAKDLLAWKTS